MAYKQLGQYLKGYGLDVPEWLSPAMGDYEQDPYLGGQMDELTRRSQQAFGQNLGALAGQYGQAGRMGPMHQKIGGEAIDAQQRGLEASLGGMMSQDRTGWLNRALQAMGIMGGLEQGAQQGIAQGYGADQSLKGTRAMAGASRYGSELGLQGVLAGVGLGQDRLGMDRQFGMMDRDYRQNMMPFEQMGSLGNFLGPLLGQFGRTNTSGTQQGPRVDPWSSAVQGGVGTGLNIWGMMPGWGGGGGNTSSPSGYNQPGGQWRP